MCALKIKENKCEYAGEFKYFLENRHEQSLEIHSTPLPSISDQESNVIDIEFGFEILRNLLRSFGIDPGLIMHILRESDLLSFSFVDVFRHYIKIMQLGRIMSSNNLQWGTNFGYINNCIRDPACIFGLITDTFVCDNFTISAYRADGQELTLNFNGFGDSKKLENYKTTINRFNKNGIQFQSSESMTFAFSAVELNVYEDGHVKPGKWINKVSRVNIPADSIAINKLVLDPNPTDPGTHLVEFY